MNNHAKSLRFYFVILLLFVYFMTGSQNLIESRQTSFYAYIYKITDSEAQTVYKKGVLEVDTSFFHTLVDSFPTDSQYKGQLMPGHYIKTFAEKDRQKFSITTVQDFSVFILNNNTDLVVQIYDLKGSIINNADVRVRRKRIYYNEKTKSYIDKKSNQKGLLKVTYNGFTSYYNLSRQYNNSYIKRGTRKVVFSSPLKYVWIPIEFIIYIPVDGVKSIVNHWPQGTIYRTKEFFVKSYHKVACIFDDYHCNYYSNDKFRNKHTGYIVFNKPKYMPGDTVKFKAFLVTKKGKPVKKPVKVVLNANRKFTTLTTLEPYRDGGYEYEFFLHDSLQLQLDRRCTVYLESDNSDEYIRGYFRYEDYELSKNVLHMRLDKTDHFREQEITLFVQGTDENDLNLMDARVEILVTPKSINRYFNNHSFIPDTLLFIEKELEPLDETEIVLSDSLFPKVNFDYNISVRMLTSDNEAASKSEEVKYYYRQQKFDIELLIDSVKFIYKENGIAQSKGVVVMAQDNFGNETPVYNGNIPCVIPLNQYYSSYTIASDSLSGVIDISHEPSRIQCFSERTKDSIFIMVDSPRKIPFNYNIYKKNTQQSAGFADSLNLKKRVSTKQNYFVSIQYLWGGEVKKEDYRIPLIDKKLNVTVTQPKIVYPGQKSEIVVSVTDAEGSPVEDVDLTAYSMTKKFGYSPPGLPYLGKSRKNKSVINSFNLNDVNTGVHAKLKLDYIAWKILAGLDSIEYFRFIYPESTIYRFDYSSPDSITQFSPFVVFEGSIKPVHVIYVDSKPVYFSWSTNTQPYSFRVSSGYHQVKLRTSYRSIVIDSLYFEDGKKTIFSLDRDLKQRNVTITLAEPELTKNEKRHLYNYIFPYRNNFGEKYAYVEKEDELQFLKPKLLNRQLNNFAGPIAGGITFSLLDGFKTKFHHEPFFEYDFSPGLLKMRSVETGIYPQHLNLYNPVSDLTDLILTKEKLIEQWNGYLDSKRFLRARYRYPNSTSRGAGRLLFRFDKQEKPDKDVPLNILVFRYDSHEFLRVYPGSTTLMYELHEGYHKLIFFYSGAKYHIEDSVYIKPDGLNYYRFNQPVSFRKDSFSVYVSNLIEETLFKRYPFYQEEDTELKQIYRNYQKQFRYTGVGEVIEGYVYDDDDNEPIPGANVYVKGTTYGTMTDIDGHYSFKVPAGVNVLSFSFIGYEPVDIPLGSSNTVNANLSASELALDEVVVIGYGVSRKSNVTAAVSTVTSQSMLGGIPGVSGNISQSLRGKVAGVSINSTSDAPGSGVEITIRGSSTVGFDKTPLYIVNGVVFTGDISELDPAKIKNIEILKDERATAIYGARGANGVVIIETASGTFNPTKKMRNNGAELDELFVESASQANSIRENFSDYAFWQPKLITDRDGKARFDVIFPDDVTSWKTFYLAMNGDKQSGQTEGLIKSYKPLMAQLTLPRFLVQTDTTYAIGKTLNYLPDSVRVKTQFEINGIDKNTTLGYCVNSIIDTLQIIADSDTLAVKYFLESTKDGYIDGEKREIPVFPIGLEETKGNFYVLDSDTTITLSFDSSLGEVSLFARADMLNVIEDEISHLVNYKYSCNEQLASKLKALLAKKQIAIYKGKEYKSEKKIDKMIRLLKKNKKDNGLWGWWKNSEESEWISLHILEALTQAEMMDYDTGLDKSQIVESMIWKLEDYCSFNTKIRALYIAVLFDGHIDYKSYISKLEDSEDQSLNELLQIIRLKQICNIKYDLDTLELYKETTMFGNIYYSDEKQKPGLVVNDTQNTLLAYQILSGDSLSDSGVLSKIRNYFMEIRKDGYWTNTYESALIIETILPGLLNNKEILVPPSLSIKGDVNRTISVFPFEMIVNPEKQIEITKSGSFPVYFTSYQKYRNSNPVMKKGDFEISARFDTRSGNKLTAGKPTKLIVDVVVEKDAEYVMLNIPIPGGCSYTNKKNSFRNESHREYFKNETAIFCESLSKGEYSFEIELTPRYTGTYTVNPAKVEMMYYPVFNANNEIKTIRIE